MWYALFRASGGTIDSATSLNGVLKQDIINSKGVVQSGGVSGRKVGTEDFSGICPELTEVCKRKLGNICGMGKKPKDAEFKQDHSPPPEPRPILILNASRGRPLSGTHTRTRFFGLSLSNVQTRGARQPRGSAATTNADCAVLTVSAVLAAPTPPSRIWIL